MFYVLFTYSKGRKERDFRKFRSEDDLINFLHANYESIDIVQILGAERIYKLGLVETEELAKSALIRQEVETDLPDPGEKEALKIPDEAILEPADEKTAMEKIGDDIEKEMTEEEIIKKNKAALQRGEAAIEAAKKDLKKKPERLIVNPAEKPARRPYIQKEDRKKDWPKCPECNRRRIAPWNKSGRCSHCQQYKKIPKPKLDKTG